PAATAQWVLTEVLTQGRVRRAYLGISVRDPPLDLRLVSALVLSVTRAIEVIGRDECAPAVDPDLRPGDLIVGVNETPVDGVDALHRQLSRWPVGSPLTLEVVRRTQSLRVSLTPSEPREPR